MQYQSRNAIRPQNQTSKYILNASGARRENGKQPLKYISAPLYGEELRKKEKILQTVRRGFEGFDYSFQKPSFQKYLLSLFRNELHLFKKNIDGKDKYLLLFGEVHVKRKGTAAKQASFLKSFDLIGLEGLRFPVTTVSEDVRPKTQKERDSFPQSVWPAVLNRYNPMVMLDIAYTKLLNAQKNSITGTLHRESIRYLLIKSIVSKATQDVSGNLELQPDRKIRFSGKDYTIDRIERSLIVVNSRYFSGKDLVAASRKALRTGEVDSDFIPEKLAGLEDKNPAVSRVHAYVLSAGFVFGVIGAENSLFAKLFMDSGYPDLAARLAPSIMVSTLVCTVMFAAMTIPILLQNLWKGMPKKLGKFLKNFGGGYVLTGRNDIMTNRIIEHIDNSKTKNLFAICIGRAHNYGVGSRLEKAGWVRQEM